MVQQGEKVRCSGSTCAAHGNFSVVSGNEQHQVCSIEPFRASSHAAALAQSVCVCVYNITRCSYTLAPRVYTGFLRAHSRPSVVRMRYLPGQGLASNPVRSVGTLAPQANKFGS